jgi:hypothetical protein
MASMEDMDYGEQTKIIKVPMLRNLVETVEEEAAEGYLKDGEFWLFTDNSTRVVSSGVVPPRNFFMT